MVLSPLARPLSSRDAGVAAVRDAVRAFLETAERDGHLLAGPLAVAVSGGPDSLALAALTVPLAGKLGVAVRGLVVDHGLQPGSAAVADRAAAQLAELGAEPLVLPVSVGRSGGMEAAARAARYEALRAAVPETGTVLLGHTRDDQAETVLLGLGRGSGPRSVAGMRVHDPPWGRPLLAVPRSATVAACDALGLPAWSDPHNVDPSFTRVRLRSEVMPLLEGVLAGGVSAALARTAAQLREDLDLLDVQADELYREALDDEEAAATPERCLLVAVLAMAPAALRRRALRRWLLDSGVGDLTDGHIRAVDTLVTAWHGQRGVSLPSGLVARRTHGRLHVEGGP